jgi:hypothetical protein
MKIKNTLPLLPLIALVTISAALAAEPAKDEKEKPFVPKAREMVVAAEFYPENSGSITPHQAMIRAEGIQKRGNLCLNQMQSEMELFSKDPLIVMMADKLEVGSFASKKDKLSFHTIASESVDPASKEKEISLGILVQIEDKADLTKTIPLAHHYIGKAGSWAELMEKGYCTGHREDIGAALNQAQLELKRLKDLNACKDKLAMNRQTLRGFAQKLNNFLPRAWFSDAENKMLMKHGSQAIVELPTDEKKKAAALEKQLEVDRDVTGGDCTTLVTESDKDLELATNVSLVMKAKHMSTAESEALLAKYEEKKKKEEEKKEEDKKKTEEGKKMAEELAKESAKETEKKAEPKQDSTK